MQKQLILTIIFSLVFPGIVLYAQQQDDCSCRASSWVYIKQISKKKILRTIVKRRLRKSRHALKAAKRN